MTRSESQTVLPVRYFLLCYGCFTNPSGFVAVMKKLATRCVLLQILQVRKSSDKLCCVCSTIGSRYNRHIEQLLPVANCYKLFRCTNQSIRCFAGAQQTLAIRLRLMNCWYPLRIATSFSFAQRKNFATGLLQILAVAFRS